MPLESGVYGEPESVREDGRAITPAFLFEVKTPAESYGEWDYYKLLVPVPADHDWRTLAEGGCNLVRSTARAARRGGWDLAGMPGFGYLPVTS
jgi:branched-chain amino acid transport system substrate-binding protein